MNATEATDAAAVAAVWPEEVRSDEVRADASPGETTDPRAGIEEAVASLDTLGEVPLREHVERFEAVHTELTVALSSIDKV